MQNFLAKSTGPTSSNKEQYSMFIGRWQPWHAGHRWLIDQRLNEGKNVLLCVRDVAPDKKNPWDAREVMLNLFDELQDLVQDGRVRIMVIPDIESINIGRGVGYDIIEHIPPTEVAEISATKIREQMKAEGKL